MSADGPGGTAPMESNLEVASPASDDELLSAEKESIRKLSEQDAENVIAAYDAADDAMHVNFDEGVWLKCIPTISLTAATIILAIIGAGIGIALSLADVELTEDWEEIISFPGAIWINGLKLLVLPLIILMMVILPSRVADIGFIGKRAIPLYLTTSTLAACQGTIWAWVVRPGDQGSNPDLGEETTQAPVSEVEAFTGIFFNAVPSNIVSAMADLTMLGIIVFFLSIGILLRQESVKKVERDTVLNFCKAILRCCMAAIIWLVWLTPIGMMSLVMHKLATTDELGDLLTALGWYILCVLIGHGIHVFGVYPAIFMLTTRGNGWIWFSKIWRAPLVAFATSSSAATLPRSLQVAHDAGVRPQTYSFILPLGAAINMDGTALGFPIMIGLIAQLNEVELNFGTVIVVLLLSVLVSVGTAPIPNAGMVYLTMIFEAAGLGDYVAEGLAILFVLDWFVDRIETSVNVTSDQFVAKIIDDVSLNSEKKDLDVKCGCCLFSGNPKTAQFKETKMHQVHAHSTASIDQGS